MEWALEFLTGLRPALVYPILGLGAAVENLIPIIPADSFIVAGGFLAGLGSLSPLIVFAVTWGMNVAGALLVYALGYRYGLKFFREGRGSHLLSGDQLDRMQRFYDRWGVATLFFARFLPGFRALVPVFAGVTKQGPVRVIVPLTAASAIWYGGLVRLGVVAGANLDGVVALLTRVNRGFLIVSLFAAAAALLLWWRTREAQVAQAAANGPSGASGAPREPGS